MTSKGDSLTGILMHITYKGVMYISDIILRDFRKISDMEGPWNLQNAHQKFEFCKQMNQLRT